MIKHAQEASKYKPTLSLQMNATFARYGKQAKKNSLITKAKLPSFSWCIARKSSTSEIRVSMTVCSVQKTIQRYYSMPDLKN